MKKPTSPESTPAADENQPAPAPEAPVAEVGAPEAPAAEPSLGSPTAAPEVLIPDAPVAEGPQVATVAATAVAAPASPAESQPEPEPDSPSLQARLEEAENRGYLRGRNERIEELMREPAMFERTDAPASKAAKKASQTDWADWQANAQPLILNTPHISIWDK
jgi:hypothetical protein